MPAVDDVEASRSRSADAAVMALALVFPTLLTWFYFLVLANYPAVMQRAAYTVGKVIQFGFPVVWVSIRQRQRLRGKRPSLAGLAVGTAFGMLVVAAMLGLYHAWLKPNGYMIEPGAVARQKLIGFDLDSLTKYVVLGAFYSVIHSFLEEYYWRWFVFGQLRQLVAPGLAILLSSIGFMAHHVLVLSAFFGWFSLATLCFSFGVAVGGAVWAWMYQRYDALAVPWISHLLVDAGIFIIGYDLTRDLF